MVISPNQTLIGTFSVAIWNRNKIVMAIAAGLWLIDVAASIRGKSSTFSHGTSGISYKLDVSLGIVLVNN